MSLAYSAALYNENDNEPSNIPPIQKKRNPHNRTQKKFDDQIVDHDKVNQVLQSMNSLQKVHNAPPDENVGELGNYFNTPPEKPISSGVQKTTDVKESMMNLGTAPKPADQYGDEALDLNNFQKNYGDAKSSNEYYKKFIPNFAQLSNPEEDYGVSSASSSTGKHGNYMKAPIITGGASRMSSSGQDVLIEKLNYMIHLLEEQHDERTHSVTEEVILYLFLGIFIIFIVDSFCRIGKYTR